MNPNTIFNSQPLPHAFFVLLLGTTAAAVLWTTPPTARGQVLETNYSAGSIAGYTTPGTKVQASLLSVLGSPEGIAERGPNLVFSSFDNNSMVKSSPSGMIPNAPPLPALHHALSPDASASRAGQLLNISTRLRVQTGDNAMIGGFIITGTQPKTVIVRGLGPSLPVPGALADPVIEVHGSAGELLATNDNWNDAATRQQIIDSGLAPTNNLESALWGILNPGAYTVVLRGKNGATGVGLFEVYDLDRTVDSKLANISTRGFVDTADNVIIGGIIVGPTGASSSDLLVRAIGPSLSNFGIQNPLADPMLELHDANGGLIASNDNWQDNKQAEIQATGIPPSSDKESAILTTLSPGPYTAIVRGKNNTTGVGLIEVYDLTPKSLESISQMVSASQGGVITLASGSSVSIPAGVLANDQLVTLSLLSSMPHQPRGVLLSVGQALSISFASPQAGAPQAQPFLDAGNKQPNATPSLQVVLNLGSNPVNGIAGSAPLADIVDLTEGDVFLGIPGSFNSATGIGHFSVPAGVVQNGQTVTVGQTNLNPFTFAPPPRFGGRIWNPTLQQWFDFPQGFDPSKKTLVLTHGILSSVEEAYGPCVSDIIAAGGYEQVVGFNYDWTKRPRDAGQAMAAFLNDLHNRGLAQADLEAHSFGTVTALAASSSTGLRIPHMVLEGGPLNGTPIATAAAENPNLLTALVNLLFFRERGSLSTPQIHSLAIQTLDDVRRSGMMTDCAPGSTELSQIRTNAIQAHPETDFIKMVGLRSLLPTRANGIVFQGAVNDSLIPATSASGTGLPGDSARSYPVWHGDLECDPNTIRDVGALVTSTANPWDGTWVGTVTGTFSGGGCSYNGVSGLNFTFTVSNNALTGTGSESGLPCFNLSNCSIYNFPNTTGTVSGSVSNAAISLTYMGSAIGGVCDGQSVGLSFSGTRNGTMITGTTPGGNSVTLTKQ